LRFSFYSPKILDMALTKRQKDVLDFIAGFVEENGYSPSYEEIAHALDLASLATVHKHISALAEKKYLQRGANQSRSVDISSRYLQEHRRQKQKTSLEVPLMGRIAAGVPVEAIEDRYGTDVVAELVGVPGRLGAADVLQGVPGLDLVIDHDRADAEGRGGLDRRHRGAGQRLAGGQVRRRGGKLRRRRGQRRGAEDLRRPRLRLLRQGRTR